MDSNEASDMGVVDSLVNSKNDDQSTTNGYESECSSSSRSDQDVARSVLEIEADAFTRFIERQRVEVTFELSNLRLGERPVTGQTNRERIATFLHNIQERQRQNIRTPSTRSTASNTFTADINALANRRCVSAALSSVAFRQDLENAIRRSVNTGTVSPVQQIPQAPPMPEHFDLPIQIEQPRSQNIQVAPTLPTNEIISGRRQEDPQINQPFRHEPFNVERQERELHAWETITQLQREIIVLEISDLVHRQLVTSALESDFRQHLEQNILSRFERGAPQQPEPPEQQIMPDARMPNVLAPPRPPPHTITNNIRASTMTINDLSTRLDTMQQMLQMMFSMQIDMQRSLRQEVASSLANNSLTTMTSSSQPVDAGHCTVCLNAIADTVLYRCGHLCVCYMCGLNLRQRTSTNKTKCPICRAPIEDILRVYRSSLDAE